MQFPKCNCSINSCMVNFPLSKQEGRRFTFHLFLRKKGGAPAFDSPAYRTDRLRTGRQIQGHLKFGETLDAWKHKKGHGQILLHHYDLCVPSLRSWRILRFLNLQKIFSGNFLVVFYKRCLSFDNRKHSSNNFVPNYIDCAFFSFPHFQSPFVIHP